MQIQAVANDRGRTVAGARRPATGLLLSLILLGGSSVLDIAPDHAMAAERDGSGVRRPVVVLMVETAVADPLVSRLEAELVSVGLAVRRFELAPGADVDSAAARAMAEGASAAIRVIPRSRGTEVWTNDTRARVLRRRSIGSDVPDAALSVLAFRSVEFLRATLLDLRNAGPGATPATGDAAAPARHVGSVSETRSSQPAEASSRAAEPGSPVSSSVPSPAPSSVPSSAPPPAPSSSRSPSPARQTAPRASAAPPSPPAATVAAEAAVVPPPPARPPSRAERDSETAALGPPTLDPTTQESRRPTNPAESPPSGWASGSSAQLSSEGPAPTFDVAFGPAGWLGSRQIHPTPALAAAIRYRATRRLAFGPTALLPLANETLTTAEGSSAIRLLQLGLSLDVASRVRQPLWLEARAGASAIQLKAQGADPVHGLGTTSSTWAAAVSVTVGAAIDLTRWLAVRLDLGGGLASKRIVVAHANRDVATWGPEFGVVAFALRAAF